MNLGGQRAKAIAGIARATASFSAFASILVITSFLLSKRFHNPTNRLVFYAAWGNLLADVGAMISTAGPLQGDDKSSLCQGQAFLVQWFVHTPKSAALPSFH